MPTAIVKVELVGGGPHDGDIAALPNNHAFTFRFATKEGVHNYQFVPGTLEAAYTGFEQWRMR